MNGWTSEQLKNALQKVAQTMMDAKDVLNDKDRELGDGDHGTTIARGFAAVKEALANQPFVSIQDVFKTVGMALMRSMGGASGVLFGTFFMAGSKVEGETLTSRYFCDWLKAGIDDLEKRGGAKPGDKTMIDALVPALAQAKRIAEQDGALAETLAEAAKGAQSGVDATKSMVAKKGRAHTLGDQTLGHEDAGAVSVALILQTLARSG
jgi:dihydroxyacetone kinase phosphoprotein-dependent L subunit